MRITILRFLSAFGLILATLSGYAAQQTIAGNWVTWDQETNSAGSVIQIYEQDEHYFGKIVKTANPDKRCTECTGERHNQPMLGLIMIRDVDGVPQNGQYQGGLILNPRTGKEYNCTLWVANNGERLKVKVSKGIFSKTEVWAKATD